MRKKAGMFVRYDTTGNLDPTFGKGAVCPGGGRSAAYVQRHGPAAQSANSQGSETSTKAGGASVARMYSLEPDGSPNIQFNGGKPLFTELADGAYSLVGGGYPERREGSHGRGGRQAECRS